MREGVAVRLFGLGDRSETHLAVLVEDARRGDARAFSELHRRYARMVHAILITRVPASAAADLVQDVFVVAIERLGGLRDPAAFGGWLAQIARHRALDHLRARRAQDELPEDLPGPHDAGWRAEVTQVLVALRELPEAYRETLAMRLIEGMTGPEIAERSGLTPASVRVNLHRGMRLLRERLGVTASEGSSEETGDA